VNGDLELALAVRALAVATEQYRAQQARARLGVSPTEMIALGILHVEGPQTISDLARRLAMTPASSTELADRLERADLVERFPHPTDRRKRLLRVTPRTAQVLISSYDELGRLVEGCTTQRSRSAVLGFLHTAAEALRGVPSPRNGSTVGSARTGRRS
jgi:DNA-binding MarR family transcriptional regulator